MNCDQWIIAAASVVTGIATVVIARYAIMSHRLAEANKKMTETIARSAEEADKRHIRTLQHLAAATLAGGVGGGAIPDVTNWFRAYLKQIEEQAAKDSEKK